MAFTPKDWKDSPLTTTPLTAVALEDLEVRITDYVDQEIAAIGGPGPGPINVRLDTGGFESNNLNHWNTSGVGDVAPTVVTDIKKSGTYAAKFILTGSQNRSELILGGDGSGSTTGTEEFYHGEYFAYEWNFYIVSPFHYGAPGNHMSIVQVHDGTNASFSIYLWDSGGNKGIWVAGALNGGDTFKTTVTENAWHTARIECLSTTDTTGYLRCYIDGNLIYSVTNVRTITNSATHHYIKTGLYRNGTASPGTSEIRVDDAVLYGA